MSGSSPGYTSNYLLSQQVSQLESKIRKMDKLFDQEVQSEVQRALHSSTKDQANNANASARRARVPASARASAARRGVVKARRRSARCGVK